MFEYNQYVVHNSTSKYREYSVAVMDSDGNKLPIKKCGTLSAGETDIELSTGDSKLIIDALRKGGLVHFAITDTNNSINQYNFTIISDLFSDAYEAWWQK